MAEGSQNGLLGRVLGLDDKGLVLNEEQLTRSYWACCECTLTRAGLGDVEWGVYDGGSDMIRGGCTVGAPVVIWGEDRGDRGGRVRWNRGWK
jgi:hypothetical protein